MLRFSRTFGADLGRAATATGAVTTSAIGAAATPPVPTMEMEAVIEPEPTPTVVNESAAGKLIGAAGATASAGEVPRRL